MDTPGVSLFQGADLQINNSQNVEEEEDLEDQLRRKEELQNLLQANLDEFKYDESTINSSNNVSLVSAENLEQIYKDTLSPTEQLKVLYDVRCRELQSLKDEYELFKLEKTKEIDMLKKKNVLLEAELRQLSVSLKNSENLLVDKTEEINSLSKDLKEKVNQVDRLEKINKNYDTELSTCKSEIAELHLKCQSQNGPFNLNAKYNSEELRKSLQVKIEKLEDALDQEAKNLEISNTERQALQDEVARLATEKLALEKDNSTILKNFDDAQLQCKELVDILEMVKQENEHFKARLNERDKDDTAVYTAMENDTQNEKLRKMLLDKSVELDSLKIKLRNYENNLKEIMEYRQMKCDLYKKDFTQCDNKNHAKDLILMQNELHNYRQIIDDKNKQIQSLNTNNVDLKEKIEEMLLQTRNEIQNISSKYNMPQLEVMRKELEKAEYTEKMLSKKLEDSEQQRISLLQKLQSESYRKDAEALAQEVEKLRANLNNAESMLAEERERNMEMLKQIELKNTEILQIKNQFEDRQNLKQSKDGKQCNQNTYESINMKNEYEALKTQLKSVMEHLEKKSTNKEYPRIIMEIKHQMDNFLDRVEKDSIEKGVIEEQISSWKKLLDQIEIKDSDELLKSQYKEAVMNLRSTQEKLKELEETLQDLKNAITIAEGEKCSLSVELKEYSKKLENSENLQHSLEKEIYQLRALLNERDSEITKMKTSKRKDYRNVDENNIIENLQKDIKHLSDQLTNKENDLSKATDAKKRLELEKVELKKLFEKMNSDIDILKNKNQRLENALQEDKGVGDHNNVKVEKEQNAENNYEFKNRLEEELTKHEVKLRDELQIEYQKRINDIEKRYSKTFKDTTELCKQQKLELEQQDKKFREYLKMIVTECESCTTKLENEKLDLAGQLQLLKTDFEKYKASVVEKEEAYYTTLRTMQKQCQKNNEAWKAWSKKVVCSCLDIEATNKKVRDRVLATMDQYDQEVAAIQKLADAKMEKKSSKKDLKKAKN